MKQIFINQKKNILILFITSLFYSVVSILAAEYLGSLLDSIKTSLQEKYWFYILVGVLLLIFVFLSDLLNENTIVRIKNKILNNIRTAFVKNILASDDIEAIRKKNNSEYVSILVNDLNTLDENYILPMLNVLSQTMMIIVSAIIITRHNIFITLIILLFSVIIIAIPSKLTRHMQKQQYNYLEKNSAYLDSVDEVFEGIEVFYSANAKSFGEKIFTNANKRLTESNIAYDKSQNLNWITSSNLSLTAQYLIMFVCIFLIIREQFTIGALFTIINTMNILIYPITNIFRYVQQIKSSKHLINEYEEYIATNYTVSNTYLDMNFDKFVLSDIKVIKENKEIIANINVEFEYGKKYVIIGKSGSGKSTIAKLVAGYINETYGNMNLTLKERLSIVNLCEQNPALFNLSIKDNIILDKEFDEERYNDICKMCCVDSFAHKEETIGKRGEKLSTGERSRLSLARALYQNKKVLVLDESFGTLDKVTAKIVEDNLINYYKGTLIVISHNYTIDALKKYDKLIIVADGKIAINKDIKDIFENSDNAEIETFIQSYL